MKKIYNQIFITDQMHDFNGKKKTPQHLIHFYWNDS